MVNSNFLIKTKELEEKYNLDHYEVLQRFMFERILERISVSKYQGNFILKLYIKGWIITFSYVWCAK